MKSAAEGIFSGPSGVHLPPLPRIHTIQFKELIVVFQVPEIYRMIIQCPQRL